MTIRFLALVSVLTLVSGVLPAFAADNPVHIVATMTDQTVDSGKPVLIKLVISNDSQRDLELVDKAHLCDYVFRISRDDKNAVPESLLMRSANCRLAGSANRYIVIHLKPGDMSRDQVRLDEIFDLSNPGSYTVHIGRLLPATFDRVTVWSNALSFTVNHP